ncbi:hypothetical protein BD293_4386 [Roseinatronobacter monicus]|uniref:Uncharacterized protein n=2 Tax=Roseinatronobacter monicus TaxID=393481 RepID=A0A543K3Q1_9RHOB|nr:hypothetical protein BD293_4386 [Roseinatronobacter monicus]
MLTKPSLCDPILFEPNIARFRAADPLDDVYVQIILAPDTYYPCVFCYRGVISFPNMANIDTVRGLHPKLAPLADLLQSPRRGWKTAAFDEIISLLCMSQISIMPDFVEPHRLCGKELLAILSMAFEDAERQDRPVLDYLPALQFGGGIAKYLVSQNKNDLREAARHLPNIQPCDEDLLCRISVCLQRFGLAPTMVE